MNQSLFEAYNLLQSDSGIGVGDLVKVLRKATTHEMGWRNSWAAGEMDDYVGHTYRVTRVAEIGITLAPSKPRGAFLSFPFFVLELVEKKNNSKVVKLKETIERTQADISKLEQSLKKAMSELNQLDENL